MLRYQSGKFNQCPFERRGQWGGYTLGVVCDGNRAKFVLEGCANLISLLNTFDTATFQIRPTLNPSSYNDGLSRLVRSVQLFKAFSLSCQSIEAFSIGRMQ